MTNDFGPGLSHNHISRLCRVALRALEKPVQHRAIYQFAASYNGGADDAEHQVLAWAQAQSDRVDQDPHAECEHIWYGLGMTTICEPPIAHAVCFDCRTFRHRKLELVDPRGKIETTPERIWYTMRWTAGPWDWQREAKKHGVDL